MGKKAARQEAWCKRVLVLSLAQVHSGRQGSTPCIFSFSAVELYSTAEFLMQYKVELYSAAENLMQYKPPCIEISVVQCSAIYQNINDKIKMETITKKEMIEKCSAMLYIRA